MPSDDLIRTLAVPGILFDFDGPVCDVFAGAPAPEVARKLEELLVAQAPSLISETATTDDPLVIMRIAYGVDQELGQRIEQALTEAEEIAVAVAGNPTPGAVAALRDAKSLGRRVAVVSNNSASCVRAFLDRHGLMEYVEEIIGRPAGRPDLMKPQPYSLLKAAEVLGVEPAKCTLIGDSLTDIEAAHAAGATAIGYANKPHKRSTFAEAGADAIVDSMAEIPEALRQ
ncbi:HAD-IA family hydrolase [Kitasatospora sp. NPDC049258]|uniref:HAD family hydrolase n=1 Tax=Kitasatospora sp. NPDC049258 TaxID=3155394 RepID=UPI003444EA72